MLISENLENSEKHKGKIMILSLTLWTLWPRAYYLACFSPFRNVLWHFPLSLHILLYLLYFGWNVLCCGETLSFFNLPLWKFRSFPVFLRTTMCWGLSKVQFGTWFWFFPLGMVWNWEQNCWVKRHAYLKNPFYWSIIYIQRHAQILSVQVDEFPWTWHTHVKPTPGSKNGLQSVL